MADETQKAAKNKTILQADDGIDKGYRRQLTGLTGECQDTLECQGILNCCIGLAATPGKGLCYPICDIPIMQECSETFRCAPGLKCCQGQCVNHAVPDESCLTAQQLLDNKNFWDLNNIQYVKEYNEVNNNITQYPALDSYPAYQ